MNYIKAFLLKELWEIKADWKKLIWMLLMVLLPLICLYPTRFPIMPQQLKPIYLVTIVAFGISGQISLNSLIREKNNKTLDIILCANIPKYSVIIGKTLLATFIGYLYCIISLFLLKAGAIMIPSSKINIGITELFIILPLAVAYLASSINIFTNLLVRDERIIGLVGTIIGLLITGALYLINICILQMNVYINALLIVTAGFIVNIITIFILKNSSSLLIKY
ncbi:MAG: hypothetical protein ACM3X7_08045 [Solirubrobacterales bacterium]